MITRGPGFYAINGIRIIVDENLVVSCPYGATVEEFTTIEELDLAYPPEPDLAPEELVIPEKQI